MCLEAGAPVALSSDAHRPEDVGADYDQALELLERLGRGGAVRVRASSASLRADHAAGYKRVGGRVSSLTGIGYDSHRLRRARSLILGGVEIPCDVGLDGHSDADVLTHAIIDALLGAAGLGDIGQHFPDSDERYRDADSIELLAERAARACSRRALSSSTWTAPW